MVSETSKFRTKSLLPSCAKMQRLWKQSWWEEGRRMSWHWGVIVSTSDIFLNVLGKKKKEMMLLVSAASMPSRMLGSAACQQGGGIRLVCWSTLVLFAGSFDQGTRGAHDRLVNWLWSRVVMLVSYSGFLLLPEMRTELSGRVLGFAFLDLQNGDDSHFLSWERNGVLKGNCGTLEIIWDLAFGRSRLEVNLWRLLTVHPRQNHLISLSLNFLNS